jgi:hypothetical protein
MNTSTRTFFTLASAAALALAGCGSSKPSATKTVGSAGATLTAGNTTLSIPAGALTDDTPVTLREAEPRHGGVLRVEVEPHGHPLAAAAKLSVRVDDSNVKLKMSDDGSNLSTVEVEDRNHHLYKTTMGTLHEVEVEEEHGATCTPACASGQECDDGVCKAHTEDASKRTCDPVCDSGQECDDGACKTHTEVETEHGLPSGTTSCTPACATGMECDNGVCKVHGK